MCNISGYSKTGIIEKGFKDIESARVAAKNHEGNEAIVYDAPEGDQTEGTYSLHKIADTQAEEKKVIEDMAGKGNTANFDPNVIEFSVNGLFFDKTIKTENKSSEQKSADVSEVGTKINGAYLDNQKGKNEFTSIDKAIEAAKSHDGMEAIVYNKDTNTFSLYRATEADYKKIMENPDYKGRVVKFVTPNSFYGLKISENVQDTPSAIKILGKSDNPTTTAPSGVKDPVKNEGTANNNVKPVGVDFNGLSRINPDNLGNKYTKMSLANFQKPEFVQKLNDLFNDPNVSADIKNYLNNALNALNELSKASDNGATAADIKEILSKKVGGDSYAMLLTDMTTMVDYHDASSKNNIGLSLDEVFKRFNETEVKMKKETGETEIPRSQVYAKMTETLTSSEKALIDSVTGNYIAKSKMDFDIKKFILETQGEQKILTDNVKGQAGTISGIQSSAQVVKDAQAIFANLSPDKHLTDTDIEKIGPTLKMLKTQITEGKVKVTSEQLEAINKLDAACDVYTANKAKGQEALTAKTTARVNAENESKVLMEQLQRMKTETKGENDLVKELSNIMGGFAKVCEKGDELQIALYSSYMQKVTKYFKDNQFVKDGDFSGLMKISDEYRALSGGPAGQNGNPPACVGKITEVYLKNPNATPAELKVLLNAEVQKFVGSDTPQGKLLNNIVNNTDIVEKYKKKFDDSMTKAHHGEEHNETDQMHHASTFSLFNTPYVFNFSTFGNSSNFVSPLLMPPYLGLTPLIPPTFSMLSNPADKGLMGDLTLKTNFPGPYKPEFLTSGTETGDVASTNPLGLVETGGETTALADTTIEDGKNFIKKFSTNLETGAFNPYVFAQFDNAISELTSTTNTFINVNNDIKASLNKINEVAVNNIKIFSLPSFSQVLNNMIQNLDSGGIDKTKPAKEDTTMADKAFYSEINIVIQSHIDAAEQLLAEFLESGSQMDGKAANIVSLLKAFRAIIVELDMGTRDISSVTSKRIGIDKKFLKDLKETRARWDQLDVEKSQMLKAFKGSKEVNESGISGFAKSEKFNNFLSYLSSMVAEYQKNIS